MFCIETGFAANRQRKLAAQSEMAQRVTRPPPVQPLTVCPLCEAVQVCGQKLYFRGGVPAGCEACIEIRFV